MSAFTYNNADGTPGALQQEYFLTTGDNAGRRFGEIVTLSPAFAATGKHFLSVQPVLDGWYWWSANTNAPHGPNFYYRDNATGEAVAARRRSLLSELGCRFRALWHGERCGNDHGLVGDDAGTERLPRD